MPSRIATAIACFLICSLVACTGDTVQVRTGLWRAVAMLPGGELPFAIDLQHNPDGYSAYLINGDERVAIDRVDVRADSVVFAIPAFNSRIVAALDADRGQLTGYLTLTKRGGKHQVMDFSAEHGVLHRFFKDDEARQDIDVTGRWKVVFVEDDGSEGEAVADFKQSGSRLTGTFRTPTGDYRYLAGNVRDHTLSLSCFDGGHAFLFRATLDADRELRGDFWSGTAWHETWRAERDDSAALPDANELTFLKPGYDAFSFVFPDENGNEVSLSDERFRGKVVVVSIAGSWCPNCHDEAAFLSEYYKRVGGKDVEVVGLMFEHYRDFDQAARQVKHFRKRYGINYTTLIAGYSDKKEAASALPMLNHVLAYPTTIIVDRKGVVRKIHTGFDGPGTGIHFAEYKKEFSGFVQDLVASRNGDF